MYILSSADHNLVSCSNLIQSRILTNSIVMSTDSLQSTMLTLVCYVRGDDHDHVFEVKINKTESVAALKDAIREKKSPDFDGISLRLWKASVPITRDLKKDVDALNLLDHDSLPYGILSDIFPDLEKKSVHIIIGRPQSGEL